ncbi:TRAP transporter large permease [Roseomonas alkaliterrae]|uniref:TRAP transporter large permease protein n=1 Tax=Neoroseomonas alkaliterrae TaxID=1452450 RepID=A0A840Y498_9PROT|nr:TRAP transporter large permease [Neoroseomonas alkaliterrae]MBB5689452.1 tripartite ATP-independent transporter DctM subunit [Neoroseomonas alkaliterrae]MBR0677480.1 TRAP transporter large permease [Neoroseomonas alkaliterrae]
MSGTMLTVMLVLFAISVPVAIGIGIAAIVGIAGYTNFPLIVAAQQLFVALDKFPLAAIPFFILAGNLMEVGGISRRLVEFARSIVGGIQGGLPATCVVTCMIFAAISGSSVATTFAIGAIMIPALVRAGYPVGFAAALQATSAELGVVIPPSIPMILYGVTTQVSIPEMFIAGFGPGILIGGALIATVLVWCRIKGWGKQDGVGRLGFLAATRQAGFALVMPVVVLGGIYGGITTPTEASVVAVVYALIVGIFIHREIGLRDLLPIFRKSVISSAVILFIIACAAVFSWLLNRQGVPDAAAAWLATSFDSAGLYLLVVNAFLFVVGMFVETSASIIVLAPILQEAAQRVGVDGVHFGTIMVVNLALGMITPPFGVNLFAAAQVAGCGVEAMMRYLGVFILVIIACLLTITYVPAISLTLPHLVFR